MGERENKNDYIEELYRENMWVSDAQYELLYELMDGGMSEDELRSAVDRSREKSRQRFAGVFTRMDNKAAYYDIPKCIFSVGEASEFVINCKYVFQKLVGDFRAVIIPIYNYGYHPSKSREADYVTVKACDNTIRIPYTFEREDMYRINVFYLMEDKELLLLSTCVYALDEDLYKCSFYKADFHIHTTYSDGYEPPELVAASAREKGMDIIAVTDHNNFNGSVTARKLVFSRRNIKSSLKNI